MNENETINTTVEENNNSNMNFSQENFQKKKGNMLLIIPIILIVAIIAVLACAYLYYTKPEQYYKRLISSVLDSYLEESEEVEYETYKGTMDLDVNIELEENIIDEEILDLINELEVQIGAQINKTEKQMVVDLQSDYDNKNLLDLKVFADVENKETYLYAKDFIDKYLEVDIDEESYSSLEELYETEEMTIGEKYNMKKAVKIFKKEFTNIIKSEYCSSEKVTVKVNGEDVNTTKNTIKMTLQQLADGVTASFDNLKENEEFLNLLEEEYRDDMIELLEDNKNEIEESIEGNEDSSIQVNIYTTGLTQKIVKVELIALDEDDKELLTFAFTQLEDKKYSFEMISEGETIIDGTAKLEGNENDSATIILEAEIEELGSIELNIGYKQEYNAVLDEVDKDNTSSIEDLTQDEQMTILTNLQNSKIYELIEKFSNNYELDDEEDDDDLSSLGTSTTSPSSLEDNQILLYDMKTLVSIGIPSGYESDRISDTYLNLDKDNISIDVTSSYEKEDEYYSDLEKSRDYFLNLDYYENVTLSDKEKITVGGRTFYHSTLKYDYVISGYSNSYATDYFWSKGSENYIIKIQINGLEEMTNEELKELLTITVSD